MLTYELVNKTRTNRFAFTNATLRALGMKAPLLRGWPYRLTGKVISRDAYRQALEGRYQYNTGKLEREAA